MNDVIFNKQQGGLGRTLPGSDYLSAMLFFSDNITAQRKQIFAVSDAEALGITDDYTDETKAAGTYLITTKGNTGDKITAIITEPAIPGKDAVAVNLGTYTVTSGETTIAAQGAAWAAIINAGTYSHKYTASFTTATLTITARSGLGIALNSGTPIAITIVGAFAGTITQFTGGEYSEKALVHYHISEYFRGQPQGNLWLGIYEVPDSYDFAELQDLQTYAKGTIRQTLVYHLAARTYTQVASDCTALQAANATLERLHMPMSVVYAPNIAAITDLATLTNLGLLSAPKVSVNISQDGGGLGAFLFLISGVSVTNGGLLLGAVSLARVSESIAWIAKFNLSNGVENDVIAFSNGKLLTDTTITTNLVEQLNSYRYIFMRSFVDFTGSYFNDSHCAITQASDYAYIENNRTIDKAIRVGRAALLPQLNSPMKFNADGTLTNITIASFRGLLATASSALIRADEISEDGITIDPKQAALTTSSIYITFKIIPNGVARDIIVNIGYTTSI